MTDVTTNDLIERMAKIVAARLEDPGHCNARFLVQAGFHEADVERHFNAATSRAFELMVPHPTHTAGGNGAALPSRGPGRRS